MQLVELLGAAIWHTHLLDSHERIQVDIGTEKELQIGLGNVAILVGVKLRGSPIRLARKFLHPGLS